MKIFVQFQAFKNLYNPKKQENIRKFENFEKKKEKKVSVLEKKVSVWEKKSFGSDNDTEIRPWFWFPIPKPDMGCTLIRYHYQGAD